MNLSIAVLINTGFLEGFKQAFIENSYWKLYLEGIKGTLIMTFLALIMGVAIGVGVASIKYLHQTSGKLKILNFLANIYTTVIRGTPVMLQLLIIYFFLLGDVPSDYKFFVAAFAFGINSGAYVAEIIRGGINSVDKGQEETGRSLGLNQMQTMRLIIMPQALRNILPSLFNEFIALVKETSVAGYVAIVDITYASDLIRSRTWTIHPLLIAAAIYLVIVVGLTRVQGVFERRMAKGDRS